MPRFKIFQRHDLAEFACYFQLAKYSPVLSLEGLAPGVDNLRHDVSLSPRFTQLARQHLWRLIVESGEVQELVADDATGSRPAWDAKRARKPGNGSEPGDFRRTLSELYTVALSSAKD